MTEVGVIIASDAIARISEWKETISIFNAAHPDLKKHDFSVPKGIIISLLIKIIELNIYGLFCFKCTDCFKVFNVSAGSLEAAILNTGPHTKSLRLISDVLTRDINSSDMHLYCQVTPTSMRYTFPRRKKYSNEYGKEATNFTETICCYSKLSTIKPIIVEKTDLEPRPGFSNINSLRFWVFWFVQFFVILVCTIFYFLSS